MSGLWSTAFGDSFGTTTTGCTGSARLAEEQRSIAIHAYAPGVLRKVRTRAGQYNTYISLTLQLWLLFRNRATTGGQRHVRNHIQPAAFKTVFLLQRKCPGSAELRCI